MDGSRNFVKEKWGRGGAILEKNGQQVAFRAKRDSVFLIKYF